MGDLGFVSGLIGVGIDIAVKEMAERIKLALHCKKELRILQDKLNLISPINTAIQKYRVGVKLGQINVSNDNIITPGAVNDWLKKLNTLVTQANVFTEQCCVMMPAYNLISRYRLSKKIRQVVSKMDEHLGTADLIGITIDLASNVQLGQGLQRIEHGLEDLKISSSQGSTSNYPVQRFQPVHESLIVGQDEVYEKLQKRVLDQDKGLTCMGVFAMGGAGKTLLLKRVHNSKEVQDSFKQDLVLWLTVSHNPSIPALRRNLGRLVALQIDQPFNDRNSTDDDVRLWIEENMKTRRFLLFLDDVWESQNLVEELGVPAETVDGCKIIVSTRDRKILPQMKVNRRDSIELGFLSKDESWKLFLSHAFAYNNQQPPSVIVEETARNVCKECDGLPLAIKVIAATMAGVTDPVEWEVMLGRLRNAVALNQEVQEKLYNRLRLSYDALGRYDPSLQLCYLYIAAFKEDEDMYLEDLINLWIGEGLVMTRPGEDPLEIGRVQANLLLDRCLIEASIMDADGQVMVCSMHDVLHDLALQIAEKEEDCLYRAGKNMQVFPENECSGRTRISLMENNFSSIPDSFAGGHVLSLLLSENKSLKQFPARTMATMAWIRVLDLGGTSLEQLPASLGGMKQLVCLRLASVPIEELPESIVKLRKLQILELSNCNKLRYLPSRIDQLVCLRYLDLSGCQGLQCIPLGISRLFSLQYLRTERSWKAWEPKAKVTRNLYQKAMAKLNLSGDQRAACFSDLRGLTQLKWLGIEEWRATLQNETLGSMIEMRTLVLRLDSQTELPNDMVQMTKLRTLFLRCRDLNRTPHWLSEFQHLSCLILSGCEKLEELCPLHKLPSLRRLDIDGGMVGTDKLRELPQEFGESDAFPALERFWLDKLMAIEELPLLQHGAMPKLKKLGIGVCPKLKMLPRGLLGLEHLQQIQVYSCTLALQRMEEGCEDWEYIIELQNKGVEVIKEYVGDKRLKEIARRMGNKYWWDRFIKEMWMNFHM